MDLFLKTVRLVLALVLLTGSSGTASFATEGPSFDPSSWDQFLKKFVNANGEVNFAAVKADPSLLKQSLTAIKAAAEGNKAYEWKMLKWPREEQLAFWLNAYHAALVSQIIQHYPMRSINDIEGIWNGPAIEVGEISFSLNNIRAKQLMSVFHDEKIQVALACGARSCPPFPQEAFKAPRVDGQLFLAATQRVQDERFVQVNPKKKKIFLSKIFEWYAQDFVMDFGPFTPDNLKFSPPQMAVLSFVRHYLQNAEQVDFIETLDYKIKYLPFDWTLPDWRPEKPA